MFLRKSVTRRNGKTYCYWQLAETVRTPQGIRQRVVAHLGDLAKYDAGQWRALAERLGKPDLAEKLSRHVLVDSPRRGRPPNTLRLDSEGPESAVLPVRLDGVSWEDPRSYGDVFAGLEMWRRSGLGDMIEQTRGARGIGDAAGRWLALNVVARLVRPRSELETARWAKTTALPELLGVKAEEITKDRLYRSLDDAWSLKADIEKHLKGEGQGLFDQRYEVLLYDLSSTYFEGRVEGVSKAKRGYSRDHRSDCKQIVFAVAVTPEGWPLSYETYEGNIHDDKTLPGLLEKLEKRFGKPRAVQVGQEPERITVMDRGLLTQQNLDLLRNNQYGYVLAERRGRGAAWYWKRGQEDRWEVIRRDGEGQPQIEVQEIGTDGPDRLILVRSAGCRRKEEGIHNRVIRRLREDLDALTRRVEEGRLKDANKITRRLGRLEERHGALWKWVEVHVVRESEDRCRLRWKIRMDIEEAVRRSEGVYLLRTNVPNRNATCLWEDYTRLTVVESVFRSLKHDLRIRPICHHKEGRVEGHLLLSLLAYVLYWILEREHRRRGGTMTGRQLLQLLGQIQLGTIRLRTKGGQPLCLKRVSTPGRELAAVLHTLDLRLPRSGQEPSPLHLGRPTGV
jgi:transposase